MAVICAVMQVKLVRSYLCGHQRRSGITLTCQSNPGEKACCAPLSQGEFYRVFFHTVTVFSEV